MTRFAVEYEMRCAEHSDIAAHLPRLHETVRAYDKPVVLELGVRSGNSTAALIAAAETVGGHVWSVDVDCPRVPVEWDLSPTWTMTQGDDLDPGIVAMQPASVDVLFIDTSHAYDHTLAELRCYGPWVKPGGTILMHDTELEAPEAVGPQPPFPVRTAIEAWLDEQEASVKVEWVPGSYGLAVIEVR